MSTTETETRMTAEQFLALPDSGTDRQLIRGQLMERPMTYRNRTHAWVEARLAMLLGNWLLSREQPSGEIFSGEVGCVLRRDPDTIVGIDVAYFSRETIDRAPASTTLIEGPPLVAIEILSPSDKQEDIHEKVREYFDAGAPQVWIVDPYFHTLQVHAPERPPAMFNEQQPLDGGELMPGLQLPIADLFPSRT